MSSVPEKFNQIEESLSSDIYEEESNLRYAAYTNRFRTILIASHRYVAYTSDIGESFRPVAHPYLVKIGYGVSWLYILGDVSYAAWKVKVKYTEDLKPWNTYPEANTVAARVFNDDHEGILSDTDWRLAGLKRGLFQSIASMGLPAFTIHNAVRYSSLMFKNSSINPLKTYGPVVIGIGIVPLLPYVFDGPCEMAIDWIFDKGEDLYKKRRIRLLQTRI